MHPRAKICSFHAVLGENWSNSVLVPRLGYPGLATVDFHTLVNGKVIIRFYFILPGGHVSCDELKKTEFFDPFFIRCVTVHAPEEGMSMNLEGPSYGFTLVSLSGSHFFDVLKYTENLDLHQIPGILDTSYPGVGGEGLRVLIHPPNSKPYPSTSGMLVVFHLFFCVSVLLDVEVEIFT